MNTAGVSSRLLIDRRLRPHNNHHHHHQQPLNCPRCDSINTKFCYYNNYNLSQPRHFCKNCRRYWTNGGVLRNVPVGGGCRKSHRSAKPKPKRSSPPPPSPSLLPLPHPPSAPSSSESSTTTAVAAVNGGGFRWPEISFGNDNSMLFSGGFVSLMNDDHNNNNNMCNLSSTASFGEILENRGGYDAAAATMENCNWQENPIPVATANEGEGLGLFDFGSGVDDHRQSLYWNQQQPTTLTLDDHTNWAPPPIPNCSHHTLFLP